MGVRGWGDSLSLPGLIVDHRAVVDGVVRMSGRMSASHASCPDCGTPSASCHSRYDRRLSDLPVSGARVELRLSVRRFRCMHDPCPRRTFSEPLAPTFGRRYGRRIGRCEALLRAVAVALYQVLLIATLEGLRSASRVDSMWRTTGVCHGDRTSR